MRHCTKVCLKDGEEEKAEEDLELSKIFELSIKCLWNSQSPWTEPVHVLRETAGREERGKEKMADAFVSAPVDAGPNKAFYAQFLYYTCNPAPVFYEAIFPKE